MAVRGVPWGVIMAGRGRVWHVHHKGPADPGSDELGLRSQACCKPNLEQTWSRQAGGQAGRRAGGQDPGRSPAAVLRNASASERLTGGWCGPGDGMAGEGEKKKKTARIIQAAHTLEARGTGRGWGQD